MNSPSERQDLPQDVDLLIRPAWIIPIEPAGLTLAGHSLAVKDGSIVALLPDVDARQRFQPRQVIDLPGERLERAHQFANVVVRLAD